MINYKVILVAVDGSEVADKAFQKAVGLAKQNEAKLIIGHVVDTSSFSLIEPYDSGIWERSQENAEALLKDYAKKAKDHGLASVETSVKNGSPKRVIVKDIASAYEVDLIVIGATGIGAAERFLLGSVSESITRYASCNVYVVR